MYKAIISDQLSNFPSDIRWVIVDVDTGEVLDDAQGYGYRTSEKACTAYRFKSLSPERQEKAKEKYKLLHKWCKENREFIKSMDMAVLEVASGIYGSKKKIDTSFVEKLLKENGYTDLPFSAKELFQHWKRKRDF